MILVRHAQCTGDYDRIAQYFMGGSVRDICRRLWNFCRENFTYVMEDGETQKNSRPITMLKDKEVDCKNYSLFIGGVLDAMKRAGLPITWCYRFVSYKASDPKPHHVFIVVNRNTDDIWVDPVLDYFDYHLFYWYKKDRTPKTEAVAKVGFIPQARMAGNEQALLDQLKNYTDGLTQAMQVSRQTNTINSITASVLQTAAALNPVIVAGQLALKLIDVGVGDVFGVGSAAARAISDLSSFNLSGFVNDLFNGRTYNTDQYWGAALYQNKVLGKGNINNQNQIVDGDLLPALKWFIDRTGIFISGREHIIALTQSPQAYMALASVNSYTTTDPARVQAAYQVASTYWKDPANYPSSEAGSWKNTIGVYDTGLAQLASQNGETAEQLAAQTNYQYITPQAEQQLIAPSGSTQPGTSLIPGVPDLFIFAGLGLLIIYSLTD